MHAYAYDASGRARTRMTLSGAEQGAVMAFVGMRPSARSARQTREGLPSTRAAAGYAYTHGHGYGGSEAAAHSAAGVCVVSVATARTSGSDGDDAPPREVACDRHEARRPVETVGGRGKRRDS